MASLSSLSVSSACAPSPSGSQWKPAAGPFSGESSFVNLSIQGLRHPVEFFLVEEVWIYVSVCECVACVLT